MFTPRYSIDSDLVNLSARLEPIIDAHLRLHLGSLSWTRILIELDRSHGKVPREYARSDLQAQLKVLTERLGQLGFPFDDHTRVVSTLGNELRIMRNRWVHHDELSVLDAWHTHDFCARLLKHFGDQDGSDRACALRDEALAALAAENSIATHASESSCLGATGGGDHTTDDAPGGEPAEEFVAPDGVVLSRDDTQDTPTIGAGRHTFEPWQLVVVGEVSVLDDLPKKVAKEQVRAVAAEIAEFEGPVHIGRLCRLTAASFGLSRLFPARQKKLERQVRQYGLFVDAQGFVWPSDIDPESWREFRPNDSNAGRAFTDISPVEIRNTKRFLEAADPSLSGTALDAAILQTFGRKRRTKTVTSHLDLACHVTH
ncbi:Swt1 family HEPN domain-containing protein [Schaalia sp. Marseille-Q2122]|uniref:DUF3320 domain-containing protein n=1 Tax=Schaalia sp. Marseille-Q2122 TaxID=2736604 RepID=UPI00158D78AF|nr:Swt1 family HEPN domain-containing protein [Schaalia sp. Marseille-Q2122]